MYFEEFLGQHGLNRRNSAYIRESSAIDLVNFKAVYVGLAEKNNCCPFHCNKIIFYPQCNCVSH